MKKLVVILFLLKTCFNANAQSFRKKQLDINFGFGLKSTFIKPSYAQDLALNLSVEYGISKTISVGAYAVYAFSSLGYEEKQASIANNAPAYTYYIQEVRWRFLITGIRGAYHFNKLIKNNRIDLYTGIMLGNNFAKQTLPSPVDNFPISTNIPKQPNYGGFIYSAFVGCRYRFNEQAGVFAEAGYGINYISLGFNYKINFSKKDKTKVI